MIGLLQDSARGGVGLKEKNGLREEMHVGYPIEEKDEGGHSCHAGARDIVADLHRVANGTCRRELSQWCDGGTYSAKHEFGCLVAFSMTTLQRSASMCLA